MRGLPKDMVEIDLRKVRIFVVYTDGSVGKYKSESKAIIAIRERDKCGSEVKMVIIGHELGIVSSKETVIHCFKRGNGR